jgi:hypothetical protein
VIHGSNYGDLYWLIWWCVATICATAIVVTFLRIFHD